MRRVLSGLLGCLLLAGCVNHLAQRQAALAPFVGQPEDVLVRSLGVPTRTFESDGHRFLAYDESRIDIVPGTPPMGGPYGGWGWWGYGGGFPPQVVEYGCDTTFEVVGGKVVGFTLRGNAC